MPISLANASSSKARELLDKISIDFDKSGGTVIATTEIEENFRGNSNFTIDYLVNIPKDRELDISNKYGNLVLNELDAKGNFEVNYGSMTAGNMKAPAGSPIRIIVSYGKANLESINEAVMEFKYSKLIADQIDLLAAVLTGKTEIATLVKAIDQTEQLFNPNLVKAVIGKNYEALYFSRSPIPYLRNIKESDWVKHHTFFKHIGMYAYRADILRELTKLHPSVLEKAESLEQLRWLENGFGILAVETSTESFGIDTPEDLMKAKEYLKL